jgi:ribosomal protein S18 acetylase RimI-like enzyme
LQFALRPVERSDDSFLYRLFESTHGQQFALLPLVATEREALLRMQFDAQRTGYRRQYPVSRDFVVAVAGESAGRLWLNESAAEILIVDVAILPEYQGAGLGTAVLRQIIRNASQAATAVCLQVDRMNFRAARLYRRLGFRVVSSNEVFERMELLPT